MLTAYFTANTAARYQAGYIGPYLDRFVSWLADRGYRLNSIQRLARGSVQFCQWFESSKPGGTMPDYATLAKLHDDLAAQGRERYACGNYRTIYRSAKVFVRFLEETGEVCPQQTRDSEHALFSEFCGWMETQRGIRRTTLANYRLPVTNLLDTLGSPATYSASALRTFFLQQTNPIHPEKSKNLATALRMFLRFLTARGDCVTRIGIRHSDRGEMEVVHAAEIYPSS